MAAKKTFCDHAEEVLIQLGNPWLEASRIKDLVWERMRGATPTIRVASSKLKKDGRFVSRYAEPGKRQIKRWSLKKIPEKI